jgi:gliding motility-associated-like protein
VFAPIPVSITGNTSIEACESTQLTAQPPGQTYLWGPNVSLQCGDCQMATVSPDATQQYWVNYTDVNGCPAGDTTVVDVNAVYTYFMPTAFSPNGDRNNDVLLVHGRGISSIDLKIYDRVGEKVFETTDILQGWDGTLYGVAMNNNEFVYTLEVIYCNGETVKEQGSLSLVK